SQWSPSSLREILRRELYTGRLVYGKTRVIDRGGRTGIKVAAPESEWIVVDRPDLRIVSDELWNAARTRIKNTGALYLRRKSGRLSSKPESGLESQYLLSGFLRCGLCRGNMIAVKRKGKGKTVSRGYACATHMSRPGDCPPNRAVPM